MRFRAFRLLGVFLISLAAFYYLGMPVKVYLSLLDCVLIMSLVMYAGKANKTFILELLFCSLANSAAFFLCDLYLNGLCLNRYVNMGIIFYSVLGLYAVLQMIIIASLASIYIRHIIDSKNKEYNDSKNNDFIDSCFSSPSKNSISESFLSERVYDLKRLEEYISYERIVGINGAWGTGKTTLSEEYYNRHSKNLHRIKLDVLTCNENELDTYLVHELDKILLNNHIYSKNGKMLRNILSGKSLIKDVWQFFSSDNDNLKTKVFDDYKTDISLLKNPVLIVVEDLDRLQDVKVIKRVFDFTERLSDSYIRIIYEYDSKKLEDIGINREYVEKYIPYVVNLTPTPISDVIIHCIKDFDGLDYADFRHLFSPINIDPYIGQEFSFHPVMFIDNSNASIRKVRTYLEEVQIVKRDEEIDYEDNKKAIITFYFMKHFYFEIYNSLAFTSDFLDEIEFISPKDEKKYTIQMLLDEIHLNEETQKQAEHGLTKDDVRNFFYNLNDVNHDKVREYNQNLFILLLSMGYDLRSMDENHIMAVTTKKETDITVKQSDYYERIFQENIRELERRHHNEKINSIIRHLHSSGKSGLTDNEFIAEKFINEVLLSSGNALDAWQTFINDVFERASDRDNTSIFRLIGEKDVELAKAFSVLLRRKKWEDKAEDIWKELIDFRPIILREYNNTSMVINMAFISFCYYVDISKRSIYKKMIELFNRMRIVSSPKKERFYYDFLKKYLTYSHIHGYIEKYDDFRIEYNSDSPEASKDFVIEYLNDLTNKVNNLCDSGLLKDNALEDEKMVRTFLMNNVKILKSSETSKRRYISPKVSISTQMQHTDECVYEELKKKAETDINKESYVLDLNREYNDGNLSITEMRSLIERFDENHSS